MLHIFLPPWPFVPLAEVFLAYLFLIFIFGIKYYSIYVADRSSYAFVSSIAEAQEKLSQREASDQLARKVPEFDLLTRIETELAANPDLQLERVKQPFYKLHVDWRAELLSATVLVEDVAIPGPPDLMSRTVKLLTPNGQEYETGFLLTPLTGIDLRNLITSWSEGLRDRITSLQAQLDSLQTTTPQIWNFSDFLYFSLITQTTVGYGDILPNCSKVRLWVSFQILLGYAILVVALNIVLSAQGR